MVEPIHSYRDLTVWQKAMDLVVEMYSLTESYPKSELYGLVSQSRRCAVSIPSNIAEGRRRGSKKDFCHFLVIAFASGAELETQIDIAIRLKYISSEKVVKAASLLNEVMRMLNTMTKNMKE